MFIHDQKHSTQLLRPVCVSLIESEFFKIIFKIIFMFVYY
jgi:hypothetical protein